MTTSVLDAIVKLPKYVKILATNGIDENTAIVLKEKEKKPKSKYNKEYCKRWYENHKEDKRNYAVANKDHIAEYHKRYYCEHKNKNKNEVS